MDGKAVAQEATEETKKIRAWVRVFSVLSVFSCEMVCFL
jgi:hypothetical protein